MVTPLLPKVDKNDFSHTNITELITLCQRAGILGAHRGIPRNTLIALLRGETTSRAVDMPDPVDEYREMMLYLQESMPDIIKGQLKCSSDHYFCPICPPARVVACALVNFDAGFREQTLKEMKMGQK